MAIRSVRYSVTRPYFLNIKQILLPTAQQKKGNVTGTFGGDFEGLLERRRASSATDEGADARASTATERRSRLPSAMATLSDLKEVKEALDAGLVSQADYDAVKRDYFRAKQEAIDFQKRELRAKEEFQKKELRAKEEALDAKKEFQKMELQIQKRELLAKEAFQKRSPKRICGRTLSSRLSSTGPAS